MPSRIKYPKQLLLKETIQNNNADDVDVEVDVLLHFKQETLEQETLEQETLEQETLEQEIKTEQVTKIHFTTKNISDFVFHIDNPNITETIDGVEEQVTEISLINLYKKIQNIEKRLKDAEDDIGCGNIQNLVCENTPYTIQADGTLITFGGSFVVQ